MSNMNNLNQLCDNPSTLEEKSRKAELLRSVLPACQPQEGSPANTFTLSELEELQAALPNIQIGGKSKNTAESADLDRINICNPEDWQEAPIPVTQEAPQEEPQEEPQEAPQEASQEAPQEAPQAAPQAAPQETPKEGGLLLEDNIVDLDWHGAPKFCVDKVRTPRAFRAKVRAGEFNGPTNAQCPGFMQCNVVILPQGQHAFDFMLFCQRNPQACPLVEVCDVGSPFPSGIAPGADLRTDIPKYAIYRNGKLEKEVTNVTDCWPKDSVAFLIGCSFSYDGALMDAGVPLRSVEQHKNVPMYRTNLKCRPAGSLKGNMVVSMKPIPALQISKEVEITSKYPHAHGGPVCVGSPAAIGVDNIEEPDWGDAVDMQPGDIPVFHACGVTPQNVLMESKVPFAITHSAGHMFVTDLPSDMGR